MVVERAWQSEPFTLCTQDTEKAKACTMGFPPLSPFQPLLASSLWGGAIHTRGRSPKVSLETLGVCIPALLAVLSLVVLIFTESA